MNVIKNTITQSTYSYTNKNKAKKRQPWINSGIIQSIYLFIEYTLQTHNNVITGKG